MTRSDLARLVRYEGNLDGAVLPGDFRSAQVDASCSEDHLPHYVEESLSALGPCSKRDVEIFRNLLTSKAPVGILLQDVASISETSITEIHAAVCRVCNAWVEVAPQHDVAARMPISHVIGRLVDRWVSHRDANLSDDERRAIPSNEATREGFVKNDLTAKTLFDAISRLSAPALLAAGALAQRKVERAGRVTMMGQNPFKVFFDTLFVFDPEKANINKSTSDQFIPYLWARLEARWLESQRRRCEDGAVRSVKGREGELTDMASMVEDKNARTFTASVDRRDEFEWTRAALGQALSAGAVRLDDYNAVLQYVGLEGVQAGCDESAPVTASIKMKAQRGIEHFKRYLRARESERIEHEGLSSHPGNRETIAAEHRPPVNSSHATLLKRAMRRAERQNVRR